MSDKPQLTVFYDGQCPLCVKEIAALARHNHGQLRLENIHAKDFSQRYPMLPIHSAERILHGLRHDGTWLTGLDVTVTAWQLAGKHHWLKVLRWPVIRPIADLSYRLFAHYRQPIAFIITGRRRCSQCVDSAD